MNVHWATGNLQVRVNRPFAGGRATLPVALSCALVADLPITAHQDRILAALGRPSPLIVAAPTGSGKSTQLPIWAHATTQRPVLVIEPRRVACRALAEWVAQQRNVALGDEVGYRVRFDDRSSAKTQILFVTPGVALNLLADGHAGKFGIVIVDEFHERGWEVDLAVALLRVEAHASTGPKLVVCSATLDLEPLGQSLGAEVIEAPGRSFPVEIAYDGPPSPTPVDLAPRVRHAVLRALAASPGDVLVFLPGKAEIDACADALSEVTTVAIHGGIPPRTLTRAFAASPNKRVFLATNVAETSLTLPGITAVIDSGLARMRVHQAGHSVLALLPIARASMDQRTGRAGRVAPGRCWRLWSAAFEPEPTAPPEIERIELDDVLLRAVTCGVAGPAVAALPWVTPPPAFALEAAQGRLQRQGTLDATGHPTPRGRAQAALPISSLAASLLADAPAPLRGLLADLCALIELDRDLLRPGSPSPREDLARLELFAEARDEVGVQWLALRHGSVETHGLHSSAWDEARRLADSLRRSVNARAAADDRSAARWSDALWHHLGTRAPQIAVIRRERGRDRPGPGAAASPWANGDTEFMLRDVPIPSRPPEDQPPPARAGFLLRPHWLGRGRGAQGVGRLLLTCPATALETARLGDTVIGAPTVRGRQVVAPVERRFAGVVLSLTERALQGRELCEAVATLLLRGSLRRGWGATVLERLHQWHVAAAWAQISNLIAWPPAPADPSAFLAERLESLGVETLADVDLLGPTDLLPDVAALGLERGLGERELAALQSDFPAEWTFPGGRCRCVLDPERRRVVLSPIRLEGKGDPPPQYLPRFRGLAVDFVKASRHVRLR